MDCAERVAAYKRANNLLVLDRSRERAHMAALADKAPEDLRTYTEVLFQLLMETWPRARQGQRLAAEHAPKTLAAIDQARETTPDLFPREAYVACQGVEGAYSQFAADAFFKHPLDLVLRVLRGRVPRRRDGLLALWRAANRELHGRICEQGL